MKSFILVCSCFNMSKKASEAFSLLHPQEVLPEIIKGKDRIYKMGKNIGNDHMISISKLSGRFAYYLQVDGNKIILEEDLLTGRRIS